MSVRLKPLPSQPTPDLDSANALAPTAVLDVLQDRHSANMFERHAAAIRNLVRKGTFLSVEHASTLALIVRACRERLEMSHEESGAAKAYIEPLRGLAQLLCAKLVPQTASERDQYARSVALFASELAMLGAVCDALVDDVCDGLARLVALVDVMQPLLPASLADSVSLMLVRAPNRQRRLSPLHLAMMLAESMCEQTREALVHDRLLIHALVVWLRDATLAHTSPQAHSLVVAQESFALTALLWRIAENRSSASHFHESIGDLTQAFRESVRFAVSSHDREQRNELLVIATQLARDRALSSEIVRTGWLADAINLVFAFYQRDTITPSSVDVDGTFSVPPPHHQPSLSVARLPLTNDRTDYEFLQLLYSFILVLARDLTALTIVSDSALIAHLLTQATAHYYNKATETDKTPSHRGVVMWSRVQCEEVQRQSLALLAQLCPLCLGAYVRARGNARVISLLSRCLMDTGGSTSAYALGVLRGSLRLLLAVASDHDADADADLDTTSMAADHGGSASDRAVRHLVREDLGEYGAIELLVGLLERELDEDEAKGERERVQLKAMRKEKGETTETLLSRTRDMTRNRATLVRAERVSLRCDALMVLSALCRHSWGHSERFGRANGMQVISVFVWYDTTQCESHLGYDDVLLAATDCVWSALAHPSSNAPLEGAFLAHSGVFRLLDVLDRAPSFLHSLLLGLLLDLCSRNHTALEHLTEWRSTISSTNYTSTNATARGSLSLLIAIWCAEEERLGVTVDDYGCVREDTDNPLASDVRYCGAVSDVNDNVRCKVYGLVMLLVDAQVAALATLSARERIKMVVIERYLDVKVGQVWREVRRELNESGVRPTTPDEACLGAAEGALTSLTEHIRSEQRRVRTTDEHDVLREEEAFFVSERDSRATEALRAQRASRFLQRTSSVEAMRSVRARVNERRRDDRAAIDGDLLESFHDHRVPLSSREDIFSNSDEDEE